MLVHHRELLCTLRPQILKTESVPVTVVPETCHVQLMREGHQGTDFLSTGLHNFIKIPQEFAYFNGWRVTLHLETPLSTFL